MIRKLPSYALLLALGAAITGCTNAREDRPGLALVQSFVNRAPAPVTLTSEQVDAVVAAALQATDSPLALATFENTGNNVVLRQIASNGPFRTWADAGTTERRTISTRNGMLTSTRGLTQDLMSSDIGQSLALISARSSGTATRIQRYLDGENQSFEVTARCDITRGESVRVRVGEIDRTAVRMTESCQDDTRSFTNVYSVDSAGRVLQSAQWLNDFFGTTVIQQLR